MGKKTLVAVAVVAALISVSTISYFTYFSTPFNPQWEANAGYSSVVAGGAVSGSGNYYILAMGGTSSTSNNQTTASYSLKAYNSTSGLQQWATVLVISTQSSALLMALAPGNPTGDMPQLHFWNNTLFLGSYLQGMNYSGKLVYNSDQMHFLLAEIDSSNGTMGSFQAFNTTGTVSGNSTWTMQWYGSSVYLGFETRSGNNFTNYVNKLGLGSSSLLWNSTFLTHFNGGRVPVPEMYASENNLGLYVTANTSGTLYSVSSSSGAILASYRLDNVSGIAGVSGGNFIFGKTLNGALQIDKANVTGGGISSFSTPISYTSLSTPKVVLLDNVLLISLNSNVYAYSTNGHRMWTDSIQYANTNYYSSGIMHYGQNSLLFWSKVTVFSGVNEPVNYRVTYNHFAEINATTGNIFWQRSYSPASSYVLGERGNAYSPIAMFGGTLLYQWYTQTGMKIAATVL